MTYHIVEIDYASLIKQGDEDILQAIGSYAGSLRIESVSDRYPFPMIIFDGLCSEMEGYGVEDTAERIAEAAHLINEWPEHRGVGKLDRLKFIFDDTSAAVMFKLTFGGAA